MIRLDLTMYELQSIILSEDLDNDEKLEQIMLFQSENKSS